MMKTIEYKDKTLYIVSTAHVSKTSIQEVHDVINAVVPDVVCVELDDARAKQLFDTHRYEDVDIKQIIKDKRVGVFAMNLILSSYQKKMAEDLETQVGAEMKEALVTARSLNIPTRNIDRDVQITFKRIIGNLSTFKKASLITTLLSSAFEDNTISEATIEDLKSSDLLFEAVSELDTKLPEVSHVLLHERNQYMAEAVKRLPYSRCVIVIGAAHTEGFIQALNENNDISKLSTLPKKKKHRWINWLIPLVLVALLIALTLKNPQMGLNQLFFWFGLSGGLATLGAILVGAHPLTVITTFGTAWIGTLSPVLAVGMFSGLVEASMRPPKVSDFEAVSEDIGHVKMWFKNRVLRILTVFIITNLLSSIGTFIATGNMMNHLFK